MKLAHFDRFSKSSASYIFVLFEYKQNLLTSSNMYSIPFPVVVFYFSLYKYMNKYSKSNDRRTPKIKLIVYSKKKKKLKRLSFGVCMIHRSWSGFLDWLVDVKKKNGYKQQQQQIPTAIEKKSTMYNFFSFRHVLIFYFCFFLLLSSFLSLYFYARSN